jgi:hypothetical protein
MVCAETVYVVVQLYCETFAGAKQSTWRRIRVIVRRFGDLHGTVRSKAAGIYKFNSQGRIVISGNTGRFREEKILNEGMQSEVSNEITPSVKRRSGNL